MPEDNGQQAGAGSTDAGATGQQQTGTTQTQTSDANPTTTQGQTAASTAGQPRTGATSGAQGQQPQTQFDPKDFIPRHRFNEVSQQSKTLQEQNQDLQRRLTLALGGQPNDPQAQKTEQLRSALVQVFPQLGKLAELSDEQFEAMLQAPHAVSSQRQAEAQQWQRHGEQQVDAIAAKVADATGVDSLDADQRDDLRFSLRNWLEQRSRAELAQAAERYGEDAVRQDERRFSLTIQRYEKGDPKLLDEFVTRHTKNWVDPARRTATARTSTRTRAVPDSGSRTPVTSVQKPASFKNWDERLDYAAKIARERGMTFDR